MLIERDIQKILNHLAGGEPIKVPFDGSNILIRFLEEDSKLYLATSVYHGGNYIPSSVRHCLSHKAPVSHPSIRTYLTVDEGHYQVNLNFLGYAESLTNSYFKEILEEFSLLAEKWRVYLDEHDKNDLIYVRVK